MIIEVSKEFFISEPILNSVLFGIENLKGEIHLFARNDYEKMEILKIRQDGSIGFFSYREPKDIETLTRFGFKLIKTEEKSNSFIPFWDRVKMKYLNIFKSGG